MLSALRLSATRTFATNAVVDGFNGAIGNTPLVRPTLRPSDSVLNVSLPIDLSKASF